MPADCSNCWLKPLQRAVANFFVDRQVIVPRRTESIEHARRQQRFHAVRNIARQIKGVARESSCGTPSTMSRILPFENVNDLLLWVRMRRHGATGGQRCHHLIHVFAMCDRAARDAWTNFNCRIFSFHVENLTRVLRLRDRSSISRILSGLCGSYAPSHYSRE